jgi:colanic acid/amylovoran biosynthesis glycosyltransferase
MLDYGRPVLPSRLLREAVACLDREPYDIVHCHFGPNGLRGMMLRELGLVQGKLVTSFYGYDVTRYVRQHGRHCYDRLFREGDLFITLSEVMRHRLVELGCDADRVLVHHLGVNLGHFSSKAWQPSPSGEMRIVTISRLVHKKGVEYGIRAVAELVRAGRRLAYTIIGDGPLRAYLERLVRKLGVGDVVKLVGWKRRPEVVDILSHSDILLAPSVTSKDGDQEGTPVALMEAQAACLPVVSTWHSGIPEVVEDGVSGYLVPERDAAALAEKLTYLIEHPQVRIEMGRAGRAIVEQRYNIDALNDRLIQIYRLTSS